MADHLFRSYHVHGMVLVLEICCHVGRHTCAGSGGAAITMDVEAWTSVGLRELGLLTLGTRRLWGDIIAPSSA